jgi:hypothetical protein
MRRREMLQLLGAVPASAFVLTWTAEEASAAAEGSKAMRAQAAAAGRAYTPRFLTSAEYATVVLLSDMIIPRDAKSGSASDAGAPEFIDYIVAEMPTRQTAMRGGIAWLEAECQQRFDRGFVACTEAQRKQVLDDIAWPRRANRAMSQGVAFFSSMRDLVATGFWSSKMGVEDLGYSGNRPDAWDGAPANVLARLKVSYE